MYFFRLVCFDYIDSQKLSKDTRSICVLWSKMSTKSLSLIKQCCEVKKSYSGQKFSFFEDDKKTQFLKKMLIRNR